MNTFDYWFDYIVRNGEFLFSYKGSYICWSIERNKYKYIAERCFISKKETITALDNPFPNASKKQICSVEAVWNKDQFFENPEALKNLFGFIPII